MTTKEAGIPLVNRQEPEVKEGVTTTTMIVVHLHVTVMATDPIHLYHTAPNHAESNHSIDQLVPRRTHH
jgi:hypothetical protein